MASCDWIDDHRPLIHLDAPKAMIEGCLHGARERSQQPEGQRDQDIYLRALERSVRPLESATATTLHGLRLHHSRLRAGTVDRPSAALTGH